MSQSETLTNYVEVPSEYGVSGRTVLITGSSRNTGASMARVFASAGASVAVARSRMTDELKAVVDGINRSGRGAAAPVTLRLDDPSSFAGCVAEVERQLGPVDVLVNNVAIRPPETLGSISIESWDEVMSVNVRGPLFLSQEVIPGMMDRGFGRIINIGGTDATHSDPHSILAAASKAGLLGLTRALAAKVGGRGVTVNAVSPGAIDTHTPDDTAPREEGTPIAAWLENYMAHVAVGRRARMEEIAYVVMFLATVASGYVTAAKR